MPRSRIPTAPPTVLPEIDIRRSDAPFALSSDPVRVLVVDDEEAILSLVAAELMDAGCDVRTAPNGAAALALLEEVEHWQPQVVVLDVQMPVLDGYGFAAAYRQRVVCAPILVMTAALNPGDCAARIGAEDVLAKPFDLDELLERVHRCAHHHHTTP